MSYNLDDHAPDEEDLMCRKCDCPDPDVLLCRCGCHDPPEPSEIR